jgi:hypothetical protein
MYAPSGKSPSAFWIAYRIPNDGGLPAGKLREKENPRGGAYPPVPSGIWSLNSATPVKLPEVKKELISKLKVFAHQSKQLTDEFQQVQPAFAITFSSLYPDWHLYRLPSHVKDPPVRFPCAPQLSTSSPTEEELGSKPSAQARARASVQF